MTAIVTSKFRILEAIDFKEKFDFVTVDKNFYLFISRPREWVDENLPPVPVDSLNDELRAWDGMLALKKIIETGVSHVVPRFDWDATGETIYVPYNDQDGDLFHHPTVAEVNAANLAGNYTPGSFYVLTDEFHVFKCLSNGNGAKSTDKPLKPGNNLDIVETSDGYRWKYMFTIQTADALKWLTDAWMPVKTLTSDDGTFQWDVQQGAVGGVISDIIITNGGSGYNRVRPTPEPIASVTLSTVVLDPAAQTYASGNGFYNGCTFWVEDGAEAGTSRIVTAYDYSTNTITLDTPFLTAPTAGDNYTILPTITISGNGTGARAKALVDTVTPDEIVSISVIESGNDYSFASATISGANGSGATVQPIVPPLSGHGADPVFELGAHYVMCQVALEYNEGAGDFPLTNDYRTLGIVRDVENYGTNTLATATTRIACQRLQYTPIAGTFSPDEDLVGSISQGSPVGLIVDVDTTNNIVSFIQDEVSGYKSFSGMVGEVITGGTSGASATVTAVLNPEVEKYSGNMIYLENRRRITRAPDQKENIRCIVEF